MGSHIYSNDLLTLEREKNRRRLKWLGLTLLLLLAVILIIFLLACAVKTMDNQGGEINIKSTLVNADYSGEEDLLRAASENLLRLHIVGNSNSEEDQRIKLAVRNAVIDYMSTNISQKVGTKDEAISKVSEKLAEIEEVAIKVLAKEGATYGAAAKIAQTHFPGKVYEGFYLPAGDYDALKIVLGDGAGKNWWCIAYPTLCLFGNADYENKEGKRDTYPLLRLVFDDCQCRRMKTDTVKIKFRCKWLRKRFEW